MSIRWLQFYPDNLMICLLLALVVMPLSGPQEPQSFAELKAAIRQNESQINRLYATIPVGLQETQQQYLAEIDKLTLTNQQLQVKLIDAALAAIEEDPIGNPTAARVIVNLIASKLDPGDATSHFDPKGAIELAKPLLKVNADSEQPPGFSLANVIYQVFRAKFATEDFEGALEMLDRIAVLGIQLQPEVREQFEYTRVRWERELAIRKAEAAADDLPRVKFTTSAGEFVVELFENEAPQTVGNFISLVESGYYDGLEFFQVKPGEYSRTGCTANHGDTNPGYHIGNELDSETSRDHFSGTLSMYNEGPGTAGAQFIITHQPNRRLDGRYTAFGRVIEGMDVVYQLNTIDRSQFVKGDASTITSTSVVRKRNHDYKPTQLAAGDEAAVNSGG